MIICTPTNNSEYTEHFYYAARMATETKPNDFFYKVIEISEDLFDGLQSNDIDEEYAAADELNSIIGEGLPYDWFIDYGKPLTGGYLNKLLF